MGTIKYDPNDPNPMRLHLQCRRGDIGEYVIVPGDPFRTDWVASFFDDAKLIKVDGKYAVKLGDLTVELSDEKQEKLRQNKVDEQDIVLGVRPEHIILESGIAGKVDVSELMGSSIHLHLETMGRDVVIVVSTMNMSGAEVSALTYGADIQFNFPGHCCHVFNKETGINLEA